MYNINIVFLPARVGDIKENMRHKCHLSLFTAKIAKF